MINVKGNKAGRDVVTRISDKAIGVIDGVSVEENEAQGSVITEVGDFGNDVEKAISIINEFKEVEKSYRDALVSLVNEANIAVQHQDEAAKTSCKDKFKGFLLVAGKTVEKVLIALSNVATIATFFGLNK